MSDLYKIVTVPDAVLKETAHPVETISADLQTQIDRMFETMYDANGIGLAANQVGLLNRVFVMDVDPKSWEYANPEYVGKKDVLRIQSAYRSGEGQDIDETEEEQDHSIAMINPEIVWTSEQHSVFDEGCLSIPKQYAQIERPAIIRVQYVDEAGDKQEMEAAGLVSHCIQHELDHLNGTLFIDYLSSLKRNMIVRKVQKLVKGSDTQAL